MELLENLLIEATSTSPEVDFSVNGLLHLKGKAMPDNAVRDFEPLFAWIEKLDVPKIIFNIDMEYLNTSASMQLFTLLRKLEENCSIKELVVNWYYEKDDEDHYDTGLLYEEKLYRTKFNYLIAA